MMGGFRKQISNVSNVFGDLLCLEDRYLKYMLLSPKPGQGGFKCPLEIVLLLYKIEKWRRRP